MMAIWHRYKPTPPALIADHTGQAIARALVWALIGEVVLGLAGWALVKWWCCGGGGGK